MCVQLPLVSLYIHITCQKNEQYNKNQSDLIHKRCIMWYKNEGRQVNKLLLFVLFVFICKEGL